MLNACSRCNFFYEFKSHKVLFFQCGNDYEEVLSVLDLIEDQNEACQQLKLAIAYETNDLKSDLADPRSVL